MIEIKTVPTNADLAHICEQQWNEIEYLKQDIDELKKDIAILSKELDKVQQSLSLKIKIKL